MTMPQTYYAGTTETVARTGARLITVSVRMPHLARYGRPTVTTLTYGATFPVRIGQVVLCPPTRLNPEWTQGRITALDPDTYSGKLKYVAPLRPRRNRK